MVDWRDIRWELPLEHPPEIVAMGRNAHGFVPFDRYRLPDLWSLHIYGYEADLRLGDLTFPIRPGFAGLTPPDMPMETRYRGISVHLYVHFRVSGNAVASVPAMQDLGDEYENLYARVYAAVRKFENFPARSQAVIWDVLWHLSERQGDASGTPTGHPAVGKALEIIERNLANPLDVRTLAEEVGVSYSYLSKLFQDALGATAVATIRQRRLARAVHLLTHSTLPIKAVASAVGFADLQHFNKAIRAEFGASPRELRARS